MLFGGNVELTNSTLLSVPSDLAVLNRTHRQLGCLRGGGEVTLRRAVRI